MKALKIFLLVIAAFVVIVVAALYSGLLEFAADRPHSSLTTRLIEIARERSIAGGSKGIKVPANLGDAAVVAAGAGEYAEMCAGCHLAPGMKDTELRAGLYPKPPNLVEHGAHRGAEQQFWIIKHGLKLSGMPAWGLTHDDERIWSMVAFLRKLPELTPDAYHELAESGGGHHHDDMEEGEHGHEHSNEGEAHEHDAPAEDAAPAAPPAHEHAPGTAPHEHQGAAKLPTSAAPDVAVFDRFQASLAAGDAQHIHWSSRKE